MDDRPFRVIVVGGGVAGLTAAHALHKAKIDYVVLERCSEPAPPTGASIAIYPHGARILNQIGCLQAAKEACSPMTRFINRMPDGKPIVDSKFFDYVLENHGQDVLVLERRCLLKVLYEALANRCSRVRLGVKVTDIYDGIDGVEARLADGTSEKGDIIIGCDGVHSLIRETMWDEGNTSIPGLITVREKKSVTTGWSCLIGMGPAVPAMGDRTMTCIHNRRYSFLILTQPDKVFFFVFFRLGDPFTWPNRKRFTEQDADIAAAKVLDHPISETVVFGELWQKRIRGSLICLEEGILKHWHFGRIVLAGDSAHKITPNIALGGNSSMESIVVLCNHLHRTLALHGGRPSKATIHTMFSAYQKEREPRMKEIMDFSSLLTKLQAWDNVWLRFLATWVIPYQPDRRIADQLGDSIIRKAPKLCFVDVGPEFKRGKMTWADEEERDLDQQTAKEASMGKKGAGGEAVGLISKLLLLVGAMAGLMSFLCLVVAVRWDS